LNLGNLIEFSFALGRGLGYISPEPVDGRSGSNVVPISEIAEMISLARRLVACFAVGVLAVAFSVGSFAADDKKKDDKKNPTIKEIMKKVPGKDGMVAKTSAAAKAEKWEDAQKLAKQLAEYGEALGKNKPKKGDNDAWAKHSKGFAESMSAISEGAEKKDKDAVTEAAAKFGKSCKACHEAHK